VQEEVQHEQESVVVVQDPVVAHGLRVVFVQDPFVAVVVVAHDPFVEVVHERVVAVVVVQVTHIVLGLHVVVVQDSVAVVVQDFPLLGLQRVKKYDTTQQIGVPPSRSTFLVTHQS
jgi:hypothetical protein